MTGTRTEKHAPDSLLARFQVQIEKWYFDDALPPSPDVLKPLVDCDDTMAELYCELLTLPAGSKYSDAIEKFAPCDTYLLDLHGFPVVQAVEVATDTLQAAHEAGFGFVRLIHGAADVRHQMTAQTLGRGGIKWALRDCLARGDWANLVQPRRSTKHRISDGAMTLALRTDELNETCRERHTRLHQHQGGKS